MGLRIRRISERYYEAVATPPHVRTEWATSHPLSAMQLIDELRRLGCPQRDISDMLYEIDPNWTQPSPSVDTPS